MNFVGETQDNLDNFLHIFLEKDLNEYNTYSFGHYYK